MAEIAKKVNKPVEIKVTNIKLNEKRKTVKFFGHELTVPTTIKYIAIDESGDIAGFAKKPDADFVRWDHDTCDVEEIGNCTINGDWTKTLVKV